MDFCTFVRTFPQGGVLTLCVGRTRMTIDVRIPIMPGRSTSGFHQPGRHCLHQARSAVRCSASRMKGELHPFKNRSCDGLRRLVPTFLLTRMGGNKTFPGITTSSISRIAGSSNARLLSPGERY